MCVCDCVSFCVSACSCAQTDPVVLKLLALALGGAALTVIMGSIPSTPIGYADDSEAAESNREAAEFLVCLPLKLDRECDI